MRLRELRKQRGISQLKLAMDLNMNQNSISRYETGEREADYRTLVAFADYFHVSLDYLLERTDDPSFCPNRKWRQNNR
jgi:transcriptional regulator with XRE-family HTH domain